MKHKDFTYKELLGFGWTKTKEYTWFLISLTFLYFVVTFIVADIPVIRDIISMLMSIALTAVTLMLIDGHTPRYSQLLAPFKTYKVTLHYFLASILYGLIVLLGLIFFILPGIYLLVRLQFFTYLLVEHENMEVLESLKKSMEMTKGRFWSLFGFGLAFIGINLLGLIALGVGLFITIPVTCIAYAMLYRKLSNPSGHSEHHHSERHLATA